MPPSHWPVPPMRYARPLRVPPLLAFALGVLALAGCDGGGTEDPTPFTLEGTWVSVTSFSVDTTHADGTQITASGTHAVSMRVAADTGAGADTTYHITQVGTVSIQSPEGAARGGIDLALDVTIPGFVGVSGATVQFVPWETLPFTSLSFRRVSDDALRGNTAILFENAGELEEVEIDVPITLRRQ